MIYILTGTLQAHIMVLNINDYGLSMPKKSYYKILGVAKDASEKADKTRLAEIELDIRKEAQDRLNRERYSRV